MSEGEGHELSEIHGEEQAPHPRTISRRKLLKGAAAGGLGLGVLGLIGRFLTSPRAEPNPIKVPVAETPPIIPTKEVLKTQYINCGFNTHMYPGASSYENLTLEAFKSDIDLLVKNGQKVVRMNITSDLAMNTEVENANSLPTWNEANMTQYEEAITYAKERGLKVNLVVESVPRPHPKVEPNKNIAPFAFERGSFDAATRRYFSALGERFKGKVDLWQIFNEPDVHNFVDYADINYIGGMTDGYIQDLAVFVKTASEALKAMDPNAKTTVNVSRWVHRPGESEQKFFETRSKLFDTLAPFLDVISLDLYPDTDAQEIRTLPKYVKYFANKYQKPVSIAELGLPVVDPYTDQDQLKTITNSITALAGGEVQPQDMLVYEIRKQKTGDRVEDSYGVLSTVGVPKPTFAAIIEASQKAQLVPPPMKK